MKSDDLRERARTEQYGLAKWPEVVNAMMEFLKKEQERAKDGGQDHDHG